MLGDNPGSILRLELLVVAMRARIRIIAITRHSLLRNIVTDGPNCIRLRPRRNAGSIVCRRLRFGARGKRLIIWTTTRVVNEDRDAARRNMVRVLTPAGLCKLLGRQAPHPAVVL